MADNTTLNTMSGGDVIAADDIGGIKFQRIKLIHGADGVNAGDVSTVNGLPVNNLGIYNSTPISLTNGSYSTFNLDENAILRVVEQEVPTYEDAARGKAIVEHKYDATRRTTEGLVVSGSNFCHTISISPLTATPTAGLLTIYDNTAESGTAIYSEWVFATAIGHTVIIDRSMQNGIYVGFDGTLANIAVTISHDPV